jgi:hypothetical protein
MANPGACDQQTNEANENIAHQYPYGEVNVLITESNALTNKITFVAADTAGDPVKRTETWGDVQVMWAPCPSNLPSQAQVGNPGPPPEPGTSGNLLLSQMYLGNHSYLRSSTPKWPARLGLQDKKVGYGNLQVWPTSIKITGVRLVNRNTKIETVELLDEGIIKPGQRIVANGSTLKLEVTGRGRAEFQNGRIYCAVNVLVTAANRQNNTITFYADGSGDDPVKHTETWGDEQVMWAANPSTLPSQAPPGHPGPPLPAPGSAGLLYLSQEYLTARADEFRAPLRLWPTSVKVTGVELADNGAFRSATVDLLDRQMAKPGQAIVADGSVLTLSLSNDGWNKFGVVAPPFPIQ